MAQIAMDVRPLHKTTVSWFDFLFDKTGELLKTHLGDVSAEPSATQLIVQFLEHSGLFNTNVGVSSETPSTENKRARHLCHLALRAAAQLQWNLEVLEENLSLQWQNILLGELIKTATALNGVINKDTDISSLDQKTVMTVIIYYRWVVRTLSQHFLPNVGKPVNNGMTAENLANENILRKLEEQLSTAIHILNQALHVTENMVLPTVPSLLSDPKKTDTAEQEKASSETGPSSEEVAPSMDVDITDEDKAKIISDSKNGSDDCNGSNAGEKMETTAEEVFTVKKEDIIAQVSFDLGTLYFYQEKFQQAMKLFESCKNAQCCQSSFYTVNEQRLNGYYMACCGLTRTPPVLTSAPPLAATKPSLAVRFEQSRHSGYNDIIAVLLEDNITFELPLEYRKNLVTELRTHSRRMSEDEESAANIPLDWQIMVCNIIRDILEGRPANPGFWLSLENGSQAQLEMIFSLCLQSIPVDDDFPSQSIKESSRFKVMKSFVQLICGTCELVDGWEIAKSSPAKVFLNEEEEAMDDLQNGLVKTPQESPQIPVSVKFTTEALTGQEGTELKKGQLFNKLRHTVDPSAISTLVEELHQLEKGRRHSEEYVCLLYKSHLEEIKNLQQQDILHILFSKALHCSAVQEYEKASQLLSYALGMVNTVAGRGAVSSPLERVKAAIQQELLVLDISQESPTKSRAEEIVKRVKSYIWQTAPGAAEIHVEEQVNAFLLNGKEWEFLSEIGVDENAQSLDHRSLSSLLASTCYFLSKPQGWRKPARSLWDGMLKIFTNNTMAQQKRSADGSQAGIVAQSEGLKLTSLIHFVRRIKEETVLTVLISCLVRLRNASSKVEEANSQREISSSHSHLWPTTITNPGNISFDHIGLALSGVVHHALSVQHQNVSWLQTLGDIYLGSGNYSSAMRCYLEAGAISSFFFNSPVPSTVWDDQAYRKMVTCCSAMKAHIQAALLCQCMEVKDYTTAFKALQQASLASSDAMDFYYSFFWDITMLEYLTFTHAKRGQNDKKLLTIQAISQPELNIFNSSELLQHTEQSRKAKLLRTLAKQYL